MLWSILSFIWDALPSWRAPSLEQPGLDTNVVLGNKRRRSDDSPDILTTDVMQLGRPESTTPKRMRSLLTRSASNGAAPQQRFSIRQQLDLSANLLMSISSCGGSSMTAVIIMTCICRAFSNCALAKQQQRSRDADYFNLYKAFLVLGPRAGPPTSSQRDSDPIHTFSGNHQGRTRPSVPLSRS